MIYKQTNQKQNTVTEYENRMSSYKGIVKNPSKLDTHSTEYFYSTKSMKR